MDIEKLKNIVQDCNINFLFGSGMSASYLKVLGSIEVLLTDANKIEDKEKKKIIKSSLYKLYFDGVIEKIQKYWVMTYPLNPLCIVTKISLKYLTELY